MHLHRKLAFGVCLVASLVGSFYAGLYVGSVHGVAYGTSLLANGAASPPTNYLETPAKNLAEDYRFSQIKLTDYLAEHGEFQQNHKIALKVYSPWGLNESAQSFIKMAVEYRIDNPPEKEPFNGIPDRITDEFLRSNLDAMIRDGGPEDIEALREYYEQEQINRDFYEVTIKSYSPEEDV